MAKKSLGLKQCQLCKEEDLVEYVDGRMFTGQWANMCPICHGMMGTGLGTGLGQKYLYNDVTGHYVKVEG